MNIHLQYHNNFKIKKHFQITNDDNNSNDTSYRNETINTKTNSMLSKYNNNNNNNTSLSLSSPLSKQRHTLLRHNDGEMFAVNSLWCLSSDNKCRICIQHIVSAKLFTTIINIIIILNCIVLVLETIDELKQLSDYSNYIFTCIFTIECVLKIIAYGFIIEQHSYLRDPWNWLDFIVVVTGLISLFPQINANLFALRAFRLLRPLKTISMFPNLRMFISTLINSLLDVGVVFLMLLLLLVIFAVLGLTLWYERFEMRCRVSNDNDKVQLDVTYIEHLCGGEVMCDNCVKAVNASVYENEINVKAFNYGLTRFDNVLYSLLTVFQTATNEGWGKIMAMLMDGYNYYVSAVYFVVCVVVNYYLMANLVVAVLLYNFTKARQQDLHIVVDNPDIVLSTTTTTSTTNSAYRSSNNNNSHSHKKSTSLNINRVCNMDNFNIKTSKKKYQRQYALIDVYSIKTKSTITELFTQTICNKCKRIKLFEKLHPHLTYHKNSKFAFICYYIYKQPFIQYFFYICIFINSIVLALERVNMSQRENTFIEKLNIVLVSIFTFEMFILIIGSGCRSFVRDCINIWDCVIVVISLIEIILREQGFFNNNTSASIVSVFRIMRILRVFKLFRSWQSFQVIMESMAETLKRMCDYLIVFCLFLFMYALLGYSFFNVSLQHNTTINGVNAVNANTHFYNFNNFPNSLICVFIIIIGDRWYELFYECYHSNTNSSVVVIVYFITLVLFGQITLMNIFLAYLIDNFQSARAHIEKNINVRNFILLNMYYASNVNNTKRHHKYKRTLYGDNVEGMDYYLMKLQNKLLVDENEFVIVAKTVIDLKNCCKVKEEVMRCWKKVNDDDDDDDECCGSGNERVVVLNNVMDKEYLKLHRERNMQMSLENDSNYYEFDIDYEEYNDLKVNKLRLFEQMQMKVNDIDDIDDDSIIEEYSDEISQQTQSNINNNNNKHSNDGDNKDKNYSQVDTLENLMIKKPVLICNDNNLITLHKDNNNNNIPFTKDKDLSIVNTTTLLNGVNNNNNNNNTPHHNNNNNHSQTLTSSKHTSSNNIPSILYTTTTSQHSLTNTFTQETPCHYFIRTSSLFIFSDKNKFRIYLTKIINHPIFNLILFILILINCIILCLDHQWINPKSHRYKAITILNFIFNILFIIEALMRIISSGFLFVRNAYLRSIINIIDFFCIIVGLIDICDSNTNLRFLRTFRAIRSVKPIRLILRSENLKLMTTTLIHSLPALGSLIIACIGFVFIFCLIGIHLFKNDLYYYCDVNSNYRNKVECVRNGGHWTFYNENYSNFIYALKSLFEVMITEGWCDMMKFASVYKGTKWVQVFFVLFVIVGYMFILNLIIAVVIQNFYMQKQKAKTFNKLIEPEKEWIHLQQLMMKFHPVPKFSLKRSMKCRVMLSKIVITKAFENVISVLIILSACTLIIQYNGSSKIYNDILEIINYIFTFIFNVEIVLKLIVYMKTYFRNSWNRFDFAVILISDVLVVLNILSHLQIINVYSLSSLPIILRLFRIFRIFRVLSTFTKLRAMIDTMLYLIPSIGNITILIVIVLVIYGNIGMHLFGAVPLRESITNTNNFRNFISSALLLFQSTTGEYWTNTMNEVAYHNCKDPLSVEYNEDIYCYKYNVTCYDGDDIEYEDLQSGKKYSCGSNVSYVYFISYIIICPIFIMNLCVVMVIEGFSQAMYQNAGLLPQDYLDKFVSVWMEYDPECNMVIRPHEFVLILKQLQPPIGFNYDRHILTEPLRFKRDYQQFLVFKALVNEQQRKLLLMKAGNEEGKEKEMGSDNDVMDLSLLLNKCNLNESDFTVKILPHSYEFNSYYLSKNKKFHTNDIEVMKIVDKFGLIASNNSNNSNSSSNSRDNKQLRNKINKTYSYTISSQVDNDNDNNDVQQHLHDDYYVHFVDACLAMSRYVISKAENISFDKLRKDIVDGYTRKMWLKEYPDQEVNRFFIGGNNYKGNNDNSNINHNNNKNKIKGETELLSKFLASRILTKVQKIFKQRLHKARASIRQRKQQNIQDNNKSKYLTNINEEEEHLNINECQLHSNNENDSLIIHHNKFNQMRCYTENYEHNAIKMYDNLSNHLIKGRSDNSNNNNNSNSNSNSTNNNNNTNMYSVVFYNPSELFEATERRHNSLGNMQSI